MPVPSDPNPPYGEAGRPEPSSFKMGLRFKRRVSGMVVAERVLVIAQLLGADNEVQLISRMDLSSWQAAAAPAIFRIVTSRAANDVVVRPRPNEAVGFVSDGLYRGAHVQAFLESGVDSKHRQPRAGEGIERRQERMGRAALAAALLTRSLADHGATSYIVDPNHPTSGEAPAKS